MVLKRSKLVVPNVAIKIMVNVYWVNMVKDCPMIASRGREGNQVDPSVSKDDAPTKRRSYALRSRGEKPNESYDDVGKFSLSCGNMISF